MAQSQMFRSLEHRNARLFFLGPERQQHRQLDPDDRGVAAWCTGCTGKATDVGVTLLAQFLPMLVLGVWAGAVADRVDKRTMTMYTQAGQAVLAFVLGILALGGWASLPVIYLVSLALGVVAAIDNPARRGFVIELVEPRHISNVVSLNTAVMTGSRIFGPALAALMLRWMQPGWLFIVNGVSFAAILWPIWRIDVTQLFPSPPAVRGGQPVREALRFVRGSRRLMVIFTVFTVIGTFAFNYGVSLLKLADQRFGHHDLFGWLLAVDQRRQPDRLVADSGPASRHVGLVLRCGGGARPQRLRCCLGAVDLGRLPRQPAAGCRRCRVHRCPERHHPAGQPTRHAWPPAGPRRRRLPRYDADRRTDHRMDRRPRQRRMEPRLRQRDHARRASRVGAIARRRSIGADVPPGDHVPTALVGDDPYGGGVVLQDGSGFGLQTD